MTDGKQRINCGSILSTFAFVFLYIQTQTRICKISNSLGQEGRLIIEGTSSRKMYRVKSCIFEWICPINAAGDQKQLSEGRLDNLAGGARS